MDERILLQKERGRLETVARSAAEALIFVGVFLISALVVAVLALAAPVVLGLSAIIGLLAKNKDETGWRAAGA